MNSWILLFLYKCWIFSYQPRSLWGLPIGLSTDVSFPRLPLFSPHKRKKPLRQHPLRRDRLRTSTSPSFQRRSQLVCVNSLNWSLLNSTLQYIKQKFFKHDDKAVVQERFLPPPLGFWPLLCTEGAQRQSRKTNFVLYLSVKVVKASQWPWLQCNSFKNG